MTIFEDDLLKRAEADLARTTAPGGAVSVPTPAPIAANKPTYSDPLLEAAEADLAGVRPDISTPLQRNDGYLYPRYASYPDLGSTEELGREAKAAIVGGGAQALRGLGYATEAAGRLAPDILSYPARVMASVVDPTMTDPVQESLVA